MSDYIFIRRSRNVLSSAVHVIFNIALGAGSVAVTYLTQSWILGVVLVLLSKWRVLAVRPRYWLLNLKSNLVDIIVGISFVVITYCSGTTFLPIHAILGILYVLWLLVLKPRSSTLATEVQALVSVYLGSTAVTLMAANADSAIVAILCFIIGYSATRHILIQSDDKDFSLVPLAAGLLAAEIAWLCQSWLIVYTFAPVGVIIPQLSVIMTIFAFLLGYMYKSIVKHEGKLDANDVVMPAIFSILLVAILVIWFSEPIFDV